MNKKSKNIEKKRRNFIPVFLGIAAAALVAVFVTMYLNNASSTEASIQEEAQVYERDLFANEPDSPIDIRQFLTESSDEVDNCGDFDLEGFLAAHKWDLNYQHPDHGDYTVESSVFEGAQATLTLEGYEYSCFVIRDVCGFASIRIQSDYPHDVVDIIGSESDGVSIRFLIAMQEVFDCISDVRHADHLKESLESIDGHSLKIRVLTYEEADALFPDGPEVKLPVRNWYNETNNRFDVEKFFIHYGWDGFIEDVNYGVIKVSSDKYGSDAAIYLRLDPRGAEFIVENVGGIGAIRGIWNVAGSHDSVRAPWLGEKVPKALLVALNAVLDRISDPQYTDCLEESLDEIEVGCMTIKTYDSGEAVTDRLLSPATKHTVEIGGKQIKTVNSIDDWRLDAASSMVVFYLMLDSFDLYRDKNKEDPTGYRGGIRLNMWAQDEEIINAFSFELCDSGKVVYQVIVKRFGDTRTVDTTEGWTISRDICDLLVFTLEEWGYHRDTISNDLHEFAEGNTLGDDLYVEVVQP